MRNQFHYKIVLLLLCCICSYAALPAQVSVRKRLSFNEGWLFMKTTDTAAAQQTYNDKEWRKLSVPHDFAIEGPFKPEYNPRTGGLPIFDKAWYRKHFNINADARGKIVTLEFDGIMNNSTIYINGQKVYERPYGYSSFEIDITRFIKLGQENIIAVKLNPEILSSRWYPGAGIYRNVWMEIKNQVHVKHWGNHITTPVVTKEKAKVVIETSISNQQKESSGNYEIKTRIINGNGAEVAFAISKIEFASNKANVLQEFEVNNPHLWDTESPHLYKAVSTIYRNNSAVDIYSQQFGIRTISFSREGFFLNGKRVKIKGVCLHNDLGALGSAVNYRATERQLQIMKSMGVNAIRTSHNPASPEQLDLCDKMGLLVQEEAFDCWQLPKVENDYSKYWAQWHEQDLRDMIQRDRNRPSIIMWSIGNEIREQNSPDGYLMARALVKICKEEDPNRFTTAGFNNFSAAIKNGLAAEVDLVGANYKPADYAPTMEKYKDWIVYGAETSSCVSSRGVYHLPLEKYDKHPSLQVSSYDNQSPNWAYPPDVEFHFQDSLPNVIGEFMWTGFDYLGEPTPYGGKDNLTHGNWDVDWPSRSSYFGAVDLAGFPKDRFYLYQSRWTSAPMVHLLPHWNWEGNNVKEIPVYCYTNCEEAELFVNGKSYGRKKMGVDKTIIPVSFNAWKNRPKDFESPYRLSWNVTYEKGEIKVVAYKNGKEAATKTIRTAKNPSQIKLLPDRNSIYADGVDLSFITVRIQDEGGNFCALADNKIHFKLTGPATIAAVDNGNAASLEPFQANYRKAFNGLCLLVIKSKKGQKGEVKIEASSPGLKTSVITLSAK
jgi:beta-galactosidase